jgi:hypothetical protein
MDELLNECPSCDSAIQERDAMIRLTLGAAALALLASSATAQYPCGQSYGDGGYAYGGEYGDAYGGSGEYLGAGSVGNNEPLFPYDDQEQWKHGYLQDMPNYGGYHSGRPYNYHHVFSQTQTSVGWGLPHGLPYSQQWWHQYESAADPGRAQTEPNGYYGHIPQPTGSQWVQAPRPMTPGLAISPVQYVQPLSAPMLAPQAGPQLLSSELGPYLIQ